MDRYAEAGNVAAPSLNESDEQLITRVRLGDRSAFEVLYGRHRVLALNLAAAQLDNPSDVDDVVADAFASVLQQLNSGKGPDTFFRAYLMTVVRRTAHARNRAATRTRATADDYVLDSLDFDADHVLAEFESTTIASAFKALPERWQEVLWYVDIEGMKPAAASTFLGISANAVSSLTIRAREGLRQAYLQSHVTMADGEECGEYAGQLGAFARKGLKRSSREKVQAHLEECSKCTAALADLNDVQGAMRVVIFPLVAGVSFTAMAPQLLAGGAVAGGAVGMAPKSLLAVGKVGAVVVAGVVVVAAASVAVAGALQSSPSSSVAIAATASPAPVVTDPATPVPTPGVTDAALSTLNPLPVAPGPQATPVRSTLPTKPAPRSLPTPTSSLAPIWTAVPSSPPSVPPPTLPVLPPPTSPTTATPTAVPTSPGVTAPAVSATFREEPGTTASEVNLTIGFALSGDASPTSAEVVFRLSEGATIIPGKTIEPEGWKCTTLDWDTREVSCSTSALDPGALTFSMGISRRDDAATLDYSFSAPGMEQATFSSSF